MQLYLEIHNTLTLPPTGDLYDKHTLIHALITF